MRALLTLTALSLALAAGALTACAPAEPPREAETPSQAAAPQEYAIEAMTPERKRSAFGEQFPAEVPVPEGEVVRGRAQGPDAWDYELMVAAPPEAVAEWYVSSFGSRSWQLGEHGALEGGGVEIALVKGGAETRATITPQGEGSRVVVVLGVGAPVLETQ